jgi:hypothetical protein
MATRRRSRNNFYLTPPFNPDAGFPFDMGEEEMPAEDPGVVDGALSWLPGGANPSPPGTSPYGTLLPSVTRKWARSSESLYPEPGQYGPAIALNPNEASILGGLTSPGIQPAGEAVDPVLGLSGQGPVTADEVAQDTVEAETGVRGRLRNLPTGDEKNPDGSRKYGSKKWKDVLAGVLQGLARAGANYDPRKGAGLATFIGALGGGAAAGAIGDDVYGKQRLARDRAEIGQENDQVLDQELKIEKIEEIPFRRETRKQQLQIQREAILERKRAATTAAEDRDLDRELKRINTEISAYNARTSKARAETAEELAGSTIEDRKRRAAQRDRQLVINERRASTNELETERRLAKDAGEAGVDPPKVTEIRKAALDVIRQEFGNPNLSIKDVYDDEDMTKAYQDALRGVEKNFGENYKQNKKRGSVSARKGVRRGTGTSAPRRTTVPKYTPKNFDDLLRQRPRIQ